MRAKRERAPTHRPRRRRRGLKALVGFVVAVPLFVGLMPGVASAGNHDQGGNTATPTATTASVDECPGGGLKLDGINDKLIADGTYSAGGITIVISNSEHENGELSFDWVATQLPVGKVVDYVVVKAGGDDPDTPADESRTYIEPNVTLIAGSVSVDDNPWYSHISFCLTNGVPPVFCPGTTTPMPTADQNGDGVIDADDCAPVKCPNDSTQNMPTTDRNGDGVVDGDDCAPVKCPNDSTQNMPTTDRNGDGVVDGDDCNPVKCPNDSSSPMLDEDNNGDGIDDGCQEFCPDGTTELAFTDRNDDNIDDACQTFCPAGEFEDMPLSGDDDNGDGVDDACQSHCPDGTTELAFTDRNDDNVDDACQEFCPGSNELMPTTDQNGDEDIDADDCNPVCPGTTQPITSPADANDDDIADMCQTFCPNTLTLVTNPTDVLAPIGVPDMCQTTTTTNDDDDDDRPRRRTVVVEEEEGEVLPETEERPAPEPEPEVVAAPAAAEVVAEVVAAPAAPAELPRTGVSTDSILQAALALIGMGVVFTRFGRIRTSKA